MSDFIFIALIVFFGGGADPRKLAVPIDLKGDLYNSSCTQCFRKKLCYFIIFLVWQLRIAWKFPGVHKRCCLLWIWNKYLWLKIYFNVTIKLSIKNKSCTTFITNVRRLQRHKLHGRVYREKMRTVKELQQRITEEWERVDQRVIDNALTQWSSGVGASMLVSLQTVDIFYICCECHTTFVYNTEFYCHINGCLALK